MNNLDTQKILLVDVDAISNISSKYLIDNSNLFQVVETRKTAGQALAYLRNCIINNLKLAGFIMIDIMMLDIHGFEFVDLYDEIFEEFEIEDLPTMVFT